MRKPKFKDWELGEVRVKCEVVMHDGSKMTAYLPHLNKNEGEAWLGMIIDATRHGDVGAMGAALRRYKRWQKRQPKK